MTRSTWQYRALVLLVVALMGVLAVGCGDDDEPDSDEAETAGAPADIEDLTGETAVAVDVPDNSFEPANVAVDLGTEVTWTNIGRNDHNVTPVDEAAFDASGDLAPEDTFSAAFDEPGIYAYYCTIHGTPTAGQRGSVTVVDPEGG
jgi:plastocyanin